MFQRLTTDLAGHSNSQVSDGMPSQTMKAIQPHVNSTQYCARRNVPCSQPGRVINDVYVFFLQEMQTVWSRSDCKLLVLGMVDVSYTTRPSEAASIRLAVSYRSGHVSTFTHSHLSESLDGSQNDSENVRKSMSVNIHPRDSRTARRTVPHFLVQSQNSISGKTFQGCS